MKRLQRSVLLIGILMLVALAAGACGDDATPTPSPTAAIAIVPPTATTLPATAAMTAAATATALVPVNSDSPASVAISPMASPTGMAEVAVATATPTCAIEPNPDLVGYADMEARLGCPVGEATNDPVAINEFGQGPDYTRFMLWFGSEQQIYVLMPDKTWLAYSDTWSESEPELSCNPDKLDPATSPPIPRRGFGKLWCNVESVRAALGNIDREERLCQHAVAQRFAQGRLLACFEDATIRYFRLLDDGTWDMEMVQ